MKHNPPQPPVPARLHLLVARDAPAAVILRTGPRDWVQLIRWDMETDEFDRGSWFHGRVRSEVCDLSPNGRHFIYFAAKWYAREVRDDSYGLSWTAISRPPHFTALALWSNGNDSWPGGGIWENNELVWLNTHVSGNQPIPHPKHRPRGITARLMHHPNRENVRLGRWLRDGWRVVQEHRYRFAGHAVRTRLAAALGQHRFLHPAQEWLEWDPKPEGGPLPTSGSFTDTPLILEKTGGHHPDVLRLHNSETDYRPKVTYELSASNGAAPFLLEGAACADWDHRGRLVFVRDGKVWAMDFQTDDEPRVIADLNEGAPDPQPAPAWARKW